MLKRQKGQGLVEFALIAPVLLLVILAIIETALIFQGYLTVQHAAREAARWAVTYNPPKGYNLEGEEAYPGETDEAYWLRREQLIKEEAVNRAVGLRFTREDAALTTSECDSRANMDDFFCVEIWGFSSFEAPDGGWHSDRDWDDPAGGGLRNHPGLPGLPIRVRVAHNVKLLDPIFSAMVPNGIVRVVAQTEMLNEGTQAGYGNVAPPVLPPPPQLPTVELEPEITATPDSPGGPTSTPVEGTATATTTASPTPTPTPIDTPTATPSGPFITASDYVVTPTQTILIDVNQHPPETGPYELRFVDGSFGLVEVISNTVEVDLDGFKLDIIYDVPSVAQGVYYIETRLFGGLIARSAAVEVVPPATDLVVSSIGFPDEITPNQEITVTVEVENLTAGFASGYFDVDFYVDPDHPPITDRPGTSKQWLEGIGPFETKVVTHVVTLYGGGIHELWAQVDTSDWVPEQNETNNIFGPIAVTAASGECSELSDRFSSTELAPKWASAKIGNASVHNMTIEDDDTLSIQTNGTGLWGSSDDGSTFLYQSFTGDFVATLKINQGLDTNQWAKIGLMARGSTSASSPWVIVMKTRDAGIQFGYRRPGHSADRFASDKASGVPVWVRLVRTGDSFAAYYSGDGTSWAVGGGKDIDLPDTVLIGIAASAYSSSSSTGNVDDFEVCPIDANAGTCQIYSDDFEAGSTIVWSDADIGNTTPGSSFRSGGEMTVSGNGGGLWSSDDFHFTYQQVSGNFVATLKILANPGQNQWSKAGLMVRASADPGENKEARVMVVKTRDHGVQFGYRESNGGSYGRFESDTEDDTLPVWVRIVRNANAFSAFYSTDGLDWSYGGSTTSSMADEVVIGLAVSSYSSGNLGDGRFDDFLFCAGEAGDVEPPVIPPEELPPGLKDCVQTIELGNFESSSISPDPWVRNVDAYHASNRTHSGNFSLEFRATTGPRPEYRRLQPWAYQAIPVPGDALTSTEGTLTYWQFVIPDPEDQSPDPDDHFYLSVHDSDGMTQTSGIPLAQGDTNTPIFMQKVVSVETSLTGGRFADFAGQDVRLKFYGVHDNVTPGTMFYIDDVRFDICTTQPIPDDIPGTASIGGLIEVLKDARPTKMPGIQVWAFAANGVLYRTKTIHDSTYHFYNVPPGAYTIYAEVWIGNILYSSIVEVEVVADERNYGVDMLLE